MKKIKLLRIIGLALGIVSFIWFLAPYAVAGVLNIGNITGMVVAALLIVYTICTSRVHQVIKNLWKRKLERIPLVMIASLGVLCAVLVVVESFCMIGANMKHGTEAECMYRWLVDKGIEPSRIYKEDQSTSTEENIAFSKEVIKENGLFQKIVIVTNEYHVYRAGMIANDNDMVWGAASGKTAGWLFPTFCVRELYAILAEWIFD